MTLIVERGVRVPMSDGTRLAADVFRPARPGRYPAVVVRTPYDRGLRGAYATPLAEAGYAVVVQDVRGRYGSEGDFYPFRDEGRDGFDSVEWAAAQLWSSGAVGLAGSSYAGYAQTLAARTTPPSLRAWLPVFSPLDARDGWVYQGGAFCLGFNLSWTLVHVAPGMTSAPAYYVDWLERRDDDSYWARLSGRGVGANAAPALVVGGWFDLFANGTFALWDELRTAAQPHRVLVGPWDHGAELDLHDLGRAWFDTHLRGESEPDRPPARTLVTGWNRWHDWESWPPPASVESWYLRPGGDFGEAPDRSGADAFTADADDPTPTVGGPLFPGLLAPGQCDQRRRAARDDVVSYRSPLLADELLVAGAVRAEIWSSTSADGADVFVTLVDVHPDGRTLNVAEGIRRRRDGGPDAADFTIELGHIAHAFLRGHRVGLDVSAMSFPRFDRFPAAGGSRRTIELGPSRLVLPVVAV